MPSERFGRIYFEMEWQRQLEDQYRENSARLAESSASVTTSGPGTITMPEPILFPSPFVQRPTIQYGHVVDLIPDANLWQAPRCTGGVARWVTDPEDGQPTVGGVFYLGFYPFATVQTPPQPLAGTLTSAQINAYRELLADNPPVVEVTHWFSFRGEAYKKLPTHIDQAIADG